MSTRPPISSFGSAPVMTLSSPAARTASIQSRRSLLDISGPFSCAMPVAIEVYHLLTREQCRFTANYRTESPMSAEARLKEMGLVLPVLQKPVANYLPYRLVGNLLFLAGQGPRDEKGAALTGKLGAEISIEEGYQRARLVGLGLLAAMRDALGSLDRVDFIVKLLGMVNAVPNFNDSPRVLNGCSDLFVEVFGEAGRHARSAVGNVMLPNQISVEIEGIVAVKA